MILKNTNSNNTNSNNNDSNNKNINNNYDNDDGDGSDDDDDDAGDDDDDAAANDDDDSTILWHTYPPIAFSFMFHPIPQVRAEINSKEKEVEDVLETTFQSKPKEL